MGPKCVILWGLVLLATAAGCSAPGYWADRERDAADIFTFTVGEGWGVKARAGFVNVGLFWNSDFWGLRGGGAFSVPTERGWSGCADLVSPVPFPLKWLVGHCPPWVLVTSVESFDLSGVSPVEDLRRKGYQGGMLFVPFLSATDKAYYYTQIEVAAGLGYTVRLGFNPGELLDFLLGWTTIDILGDDVGVTPTMEELRGTRCPAEALLKAVEERDPVWAEALLEKCAGLSSIQDLLQGPILYAAATRGNAQIVKLLLSHGASVSVRDPIARETALFPAAWSGNLAVAGILIAAGIDVNARNSGGRTCLHLAAEGGHKEVAELLIAHGARVDERDEYGATPLDYASAHPDVAEAMRAAAARHKAQQETEDKR